MKFLRKLCLAVVAVSFLMAPGSISFANALDSADLMKRKPASRNSADKKQKTKKKKKKKNRLKRQAGGKPKSKSRKQRAEPAHKSHYPKQAGGSGFNDIPNEKKDDLPAPMPVDD